MVQINPVSGEITWNVSEIMSLIIGDSEIVIPYGDFRMIEQLINDFINCDQKNNVKLNYLSNEVNRIAKEYRNILTKKQISWRKFKMSRKTIRKDKENLI